VRDCLETGRRCTRSSAYSSPWTASPSLRTLGASISPSPRAPSQAPRDVTSNTLLSLALNVEDSARQIVRALIAEAAATALDREAQWVRLSENLAEDEERQAIRHLRRLMSLVEESAGNPEGMEPLERVHAYITRTIEQLTAISDAITEVRGGQEA
jgi:hypothetical protein